MVPKVHEVHIEQGLSIDEIKNASKNVSGKAKFKSLRMFNLLKLRYLTLLMEFGLQIQKILKKSLNFWAIRSLKHSYKLSKI